MSIERESILVSSFTKDEVDLDAFVAEARNLAAERGLAESDIEFEAEETFPVEGTILILLGFASKVAYDVWKEFILPELKERYRIRKRKAS